MFTKEFWFATAERGVRAFAWATLSALGSGAVGIVSMPWIPALELGAGAAVLSILASLGVGKATGGDPGVAETTISVSRPQQR